MVSLIIEDDFTSRKMLQRMLHELGPCDTAVTGTEALTAVREAIREGNHYDLICLDLKMPEMDGHQVLHEIRKAEEEQGLHGPKQAKVLIISMLNDGKNIMKAFRGQCDGYLPKPFDCRELFQQLKSFGLMEDTVDPLPAT